MFQRLKEVDRVLRGEVTQLENLRDGTISVRASSLTVMIIVLGLIYGLCMGCFSLFRIHDLPATDLYTIPLGPYKLLIPMQMVATTVKVPALFLLTLLVTFPSLYVFNALVGSRLSIRNVSRLLVAALIVNLAVLASLGPIVVFFNVSTKSYPFMTLLNVVVFGLSGMLGLVFLLQTLHRYSVAAAQRETPQRDEPRPLAAEGAGATGSSDPEQSSGADSSAAGEAADSATPPIAARVVRDPGALDRLPGQVLGKHTKSIFRIWVVVFGLVGAQMGWVLRPFIGDPGLPFEWFRQRESNFFEAVFRSIGQLLGLPVDW